jgi:hypothetical protein
MDSRFRGNDISFVMDSRFRGNDRDDTGMTKNDKFSNEFFYIEIE